MTATGAVTTAIRVLSPGLSGLAKLVGAVSIVPPEPPRRDLCTFGYRPELGPHDGRMNFRRKCRLGGKSTVATADHVFAPDQFGIIRDALGDQLGMFDDVTAVGDDSRN